MSTGPRTAPISPVKTTLSNSLTICPGLNVPSSPPFLALGHVECCSATRANFARSGAPPATSASISALSASARARSFTSTCDAVAVGPNIIDPNARYTKNPIVATNTPIEPYVSITVSASATSPSGVARVATRDVVVRVVVRVAPGRIAVVARRRRARASRRARPSRASAPSRAASPSPSSSPSSSRAGRVVVSRAVVARVDRFAIDRARIARRPNLAPSIDRARANLARGGSNRDASRRRRCDAQSCATADDDAAARGARRARMRAPSCVECARVVADARASRERREAAARALAAATRDGGGACALELLRAVTTSDDGEGEALTAAERQTCGVLAANALGAAWRDAEATTREACRAETLRALFAANARGEDGGRGGRASMRAFVNCVDVLAQCACAEGGEGLGVARVVDGARRGERERRGESSRGERADVRGAV